MNLEISLVERRLCFNRLFFFLVRQVANYRGNDKIPQQIANQPAEKREEPTADCAEHSDGDDRCAWEWRIMQMPSLRAEILSATIRNTSII